MESAMTQLQTILAAGLTPAWQQILCLPGLRLGQVNRAQSAHWCASGKVLNVGLALHQLGGPSKTLAPIGGAAGEQLAADLACQGVPARWVACRAATRVCTTLVDSTAGQITELVENAGTLEPDEVDSYIEAFREEAAAASLVVLTGSLPQGVGSNLFDQLLQQTPAPAILDVRGPDLLAALPCQPLLVKPNREELESTLGRKITSDEALIAAMRGLNHRGAQWVLITQGAGPAWLTSASAVYRFQPEVIQVVNPIGCGDCLAAGTAWALRSGHDMPRAVQFGLATAAANAESLLPAQVEPANVAGRVGRIQVEEVAS